MPGPGPLGASAQQSLHHRAISGGRPAPLPCPHSARPGARWPMRLRSCKPCACAAPAGNNLRQVDVDIPVGRSLCASPACPAGQIHLWSTTRCNARRPSTSTARPNRRALPQPGRAGVFRQGDQRRSIAHWPHTAQQPVTCHRLCRTKAARADGRNHHRPANMATRRALFVQRAWRALRSLPGDGVVKVKCTFARCVRALRRATASATTAKRRKCSGRAATLCKCWS